MDEGTSELAKSNSEGQSLGRLLDESVSLATDAGPMAIGKTDNAAAFVPSEAGDTVNAGKKRPAPKVGLFEPPAPGSKRQKSSRYVVIDGHAVLKDNNYGMERGFISVFDGGEFKTGVEAGASGQGSDPPDDLYINAAGEVSQNFSSWNISCFLFSTINTHQHHYFSSI